MSTWNGIRRNLGDQLQMADYRRLAEIRAGRVYKAATGGDMCIAANPNAGQTRRVSTAKLRRLELTAEVNPGETYALNTAGDDALDNWWANRPAYPTTEGTPRS